MRWWNSREKGGGSEERQQKAGRDSGKQGETVESGERQQKAESRKQ
jgi:hypothetical protein